MDIPSENLDENVQVQVKRPRGRPRFPQRQGLTGLTPVEYRRIYQKDYSKEHPRKPQDPPKSYYVKKPPAEQKKRGRPSHELTEEETKQRKHQYSTTYYQKHREKLLEKKASKKNHDVDERWLRLNILIRLYELFTILGHHKENMARDAEPKV